ncbi:MAG: hypothetical protein JWQ04_650 [Pedosphaera sp.]|nr:hypothetical protein [Pedosphaera sp.]
MLKLEGYKQAAIRDGESPESVRRKFQGHVLRGTEPHDAYEEIAPGQEEAFIELQLSRKRDVAARLALGDLALMARMRTNAHALRRKRMMTS